MGLILTVICLCHHCTTLYRYLVRMKLQYASVVWNSVPFSDACRLVRIQRKSVSLYHHVLSSHLDYSYGNILNYFKLHTVSVRRRCLDVPLNGLCHWFKILLYPFGNCWSIRAKSKFERLSLFYFDFKCRNCPSRRASATNAIDSDTDIFNGSSVSINMMNWYLM